MMTGSECKMPTVTWKIIGTIDFSSKMAYSGSESKSEESQHEFVWSCQITKSKKFCEHRSQRSGQNKSQTTTILLVAEYGFGNFRLHQDLWQMSEN
jgi:hypothetical protein